MQKKSAVNSTFRYDGTDHSLNACLGYNHVITPGAANVPKWLYLSEWGTISRGYQKAANSLVAHVRIHESDLDEMVYPIAFLFRHAIETTLKIAIVSTGTEPPKNGEHYLLKIWDIIEPNVSLLFKSEDSSFVNLNTVREIIMDFDSIDLSSFAFRYPSNKNGSAALPGINVINVGVLSERANLLVELLERIISAFGQVIST